MFPHDVFGHTISLQWLLTVSHQEAYARLPQFRDADFYCLVKGMCVPSLQHADTCFPLQLLSNPCAGTLPSCECLCSPQLFNANGKNYQNGVIFMQQKKQLILKCGKDPSPIIGNRYNVPQAERRPARNIAFLCNINLLRIYPMSVVSKKLTSTGIFCCCCSPASSQPRESRGEAAGRDHLFIETLNIPIYRDSVSCLNHSDQESLWSYPDSRGHSDDPEPHCVAVAVKNALESLGVIQDFFNDMLLTKPFSK